MESPLLTSIWDQNSLSALTRGRSLGTGWGWVSGLDDKLFYKVCTTQCFMICPPRSSILPPTLPSGHPAAVLEPCPVLLSSWLRPHWGTWPAHAEGLPCACLQFLGPSPCPLPASLRPYPDPCSSWAPLPPFREAGPAPTSHQLCSLQGLHISLPWPVGPSSVFVWIPGVTKNPATHLKYLVAKKIGSAASDPKAPG